MRTLRASREAGWPLVQTYFDETSAATVKQEHGLARIVRGGGDLHVALEQQQNPRGVVAPVEHHAAARVLAAHRRLLERGSVLGLQERQEVDCGIHRFASLNG